MSSNPEPKSAIDLKKDISNLTANDSYVLVLSKLNGDKIESWVAANNFRINDYPVVRNVVSQMIYEIHENEQKKITTTTKEKNIESQEMDLKNFLENM